MGIDVTISNGKTAQIIERENLKPGIMVYTEPAREFIAQTKALTNDTYGADMNQNATFSGTPDGIHDGTDSVLWTASAISGTWTFDSTAQAQAGTKSVDATATVNNDEALFTRGSTISTGSYTAVTGYIYITSWATSGTKEVQIRLRNGGVDQGDTLDLSNYVDTTTLNTWLKFTIPIGDFNAGTVAIDEMVVRTVDIGGGAAPNYYLDTMQFEETGGAIFDVVADTGTIFHITDMSITMADAYVSTLADATHQKLPYNTLLGVSALTTGLNFKLTTDDIVRFNGVFKQHIDFMTFPAIQVESGGDGTNTWVGYKIKFDQPFVMDSRLKDKLEVTVSDDLSGLLFFRIFVRGYYETII
jgi:hypothetical protein